MMRRAMRARVLPSAAISASCVGRTLMIANSAATKNPFATMNSKASSRYQPGILTEREGRTRYKMGGRPWKWGDCMTLPERHEDVQNVSFITLIWWEE